MTTDQIGAPSGTILLDIVTPTFDRPKELCDQAVAIGKQIGPYDRWIVVDDCSNKTYDYRLVAGMFVKGGGRIEQLEFICRRYAKGNRVGTVQVSRHLGCSAARADAWIVEIDDHDTPHAGAIEAVRSAIAAGGIFIYGDVRWVSDDGHIGRVFDKPDYTPWLLRDSHCPCEGVRAFPSRLYRDVGGYRWEGRVGHVNECEFPGGDYGLFLRMEAKLDGAGFVRVPQVLCDSVKATGGISTRFSGEQSEMAGKLRVAARSGTLIVEPLSEPIDRVSSSELAS